jgi:cysteine-rich repeat protein
MTKTTLGAYLGAAILAGATILGCGGGGGGGGSGVDGGTDAAEVLACQDGIQAAGWSLVESRLAAAEGCAAAIVGCRMREEINGASGDTASCFAAADAACAAALASVTSAAFESAVTDACGALSAADLDAGLGAGRLGAHCADLGGSAAGLDALTACLADSAECAAADALAAASPRAPALIAARGIALANAACPGLPSVTGIFQAAVVTGELGALFDGIVDGFPGIAPMDGVPDIAGNPLGVALKSGVTEERAVGEFPVATVIGSGVTAASIATVTLTFNVDDVLSTFGPGTAFDGTAAERFLIHVYAGDGAVTLADFERATGAPTATVSTGAHGTITDQTLAASGPVVFQVDLTSAVKSLVASGATHIGVVWSTDDDQTGTSIDDLGFGGSGPPGVGGARLPFLTVVLAGQSVCGDSIVSAGEACDDGPENSDTVPDACRTDCTLPACGDGVRDSGEGCDDGNQAGGDGCDAGCALERSETCGDGVLDGGEECDAGDANSDTIPGACRTSCRLPACGDGVVDGGEECDPPGATCSATCTIVAQDLSAPFVRCHDALVAAGGVFAAENADGIAACLRAQLACDVDGAGGGCLGGADAACAQAEAAYAASLDQFAAAGIAACGGRPLGDVVGALGYEDGLAACAGRGLPTATVGDLVRCVYDGAACALSELAAVLAPGGAAAAAARGATPGLRCLAVP